MSHDDAESLVAAAFSTPPADCQSLLIGFSGGLDSTVLLHRLATDPRFTVRAIHIHHGLHPDAELWLRRCEQTCERLGVPLAVVRVRVDNAGGIGLEGAARQARYHAYAQALVAGDCLVTAHHQDDQAETVLLRLLRGSGGGGLAAMRPLRAFAAGQHWRPLLGVPRATLQTYAQTHGLSWSDDPSNAHARQDRNFLRLQIIPALRERWPQAASALARSAQLLAEQEALLDEQVDERLGLIANAQSRTLSIAGLQQMSAPWRARVLRRWVDSLALPPLPATGVEQIERHLLFARADALAQFRWHGAAIRRWRDLLFAEALVADLPTDWSTAWNGGTPLPLPTGGRLQLLQGQRLDTDRSSAPDVSFQVRARIGGERILLPGRAHSHAVKIALQDAAVPPWQRKRLPLVFAADGELLAVGGVLRSGRAQAAGWSFQVEDAIPLR